MTNEPMAPFFTPSHTIKMMIRTYIEEKRAKQKQQGEEKAKTVGAYPAYVIEEEQKEIEDGA